MTTPDSPYAAQVRLLVRVLPIVAGERCFALKGGTAINLFVRDMPRLSVDIDLAYMPIDDRVTALTEIESALRRIADKLTARTHGYAVREGKHEDNHVYGLLVSDRDAQIKVEVSPVLRGSVYPQTLRRIVARAEAEYGFAEVPVVSFADLYAGKIVAALDRQHPRDLFDVKLLLAAEGIGDELLCATLIYLVSHDGSIARLLDPTMKPLEDLFERQFAGMTSEAVTLGELEEARAQLIATLHSRIREREKAFLLSFKRREPRWDLLGVERAHELPALRWKLRNLAQMSPANHRKALNGLERLLDSI